mmetsp:Transcript_31221/g.58611  ORF Transcript_31221/g.58611 Transcript_31221/m.58611 type:complete len:277 (+) Transcript_31221:61-891(+)
MATQGPPNEELFVTGLPMDCSNDYCKAIFGQYGIVKDATVLPVAEGKTAAAAFVVMNSVDDAKWIVEHVNGNVPQSLTTPVTVVFRTPKDKRFGKGKGDFGAPPALGGKGSEAAVKGMAALVQLMLPMVGALAAAGAKGGCKGGGFGKDAGFKKGMGKIDGPTSGPPNETIYVTGLPQDCSSDFCKSIFGQYGIVKDAHVLPIAPGKTAAAAFVEMSSTDDAKWVVEHVSGNVPQSLTEPVTIVFATPRAERKGGKGKEKGKGGFGMQMGGMEAWN